MHQPPANTLLWRRVFIALVAGCLIGLLQTNVSHAGCGDYVVIGGKRMMSDHSSHAATSKPSRQLSEKRYLGTEVDKPIEVPTCNGLSCRRQVPTPQAPVPLVQIEDRQVGLLQTTLVLITAGPHFEVVDFETLCRPVVFGSGVFHPPRSAA